MLPSSPLNLNGVKTDLGQVTCCTVKEVSACGYGDGRRDRSIILPNHKVIGRVDMLSCFYLA